MTFERRNEMSGITKRVYFPAKSGHNSKVNRCRFHYLENRLSLSQFFFLFCRLLVLSKRIKVASFQAHLICFFYPLEGIFFRIWLKYNVMEGEDKTWTRGPWTPTLDRVHGPLSWTGSMDPLSWTRSMDTFF